MAETTGKIILSYDINGEWVAVKNALLEIGYSDSAISLVTNKIYSMPNTTVWHLQKQASQAIDDIKKICLNLNVKLEKAVAVLVNEQVAYYNK